MMPPGLTMGATPFDERRHVGHVLDHFEQQHGIDSCAPLAAISSAVAT